MINNEKGKQSNSIFRKLLDDKSQKKLKFDMPRLPRLKIIDIFGHIFSKYHFQDLKLLKQMYITDKNNIVNLNWPQKYAVQNATRSEAQQMVVF